MVSGGVTTASEGGTPKNRGDRVASILQGPGAQEESKTVPLISARCEVTRCVVGDSLSAMFFVRNSTGG